MDTHPIDEKIFIRNLESPRRKSRRKSVKKSKKKPKYRQTPSSNIPKLEDDDEVYGGDDYGSADYGGDDYGGDDYADVSNGDHDLSEDDYVIKRSRGPIVVFFIIFIVVGIIINVILLYNLPKFDSEGNEIPDDEKNMAAINSVAFAILTAIILGGAIFMIMKRGNYNNMGVGFIIIAFIAFIILFLMGLIAGEYLNVGHLWAPIQIIPADI